MASTLILALLFIVNPAKSQLDCERGWGMSSFKAYLGDVHGYTQEEVKQIKGAYKEICGGLALQPWSIAKNLPQFKKVIRAYKTENWIDHPDFVHQLGIKTKTDLSQSIPDPNPGQVKQKFDENFDQLVTKWSTVDVYDKPKPPTKPKVIKPGNYFICYDIADMGAFMEKQKVDKTRVKNAKQQAIDKEKKPILDLVKVHLWPIIWITPFNWMKDNYKWLTMKLVKQYVYYQGAENEDWAHAERDINAEEFLAGFKKSTETDEAKMIEDALNFMLERGLSRDDQKKQAMPWWKKKIYPDDKGKKAMIKATEDAIRKWLTEHNTEVTAMKLKEHLETLKTLPKPARREYRNYMNEADNYWFDDEDQEDDQQNVEYLHHEHDRIYSNDDQYHVQQQGYHSMDALVLILGVVLTVIVFCCVCIGAVMIGGIIGYFVRGYNKNKSSNRTKNGQEYQQQIDMEAQSN